MGNGGAKNGSKLNNNRLEFTIDLARSAGMFAKSHFAEIDALKIESKGHQDLVSNADIDTETIIRNAIEKQFPDDGIVGEEHGRKFGTSGYDWVIDPIDGTANFVRGIPQWCVIIACIKDGETQIGVIFEPCSNELFHATKGGGAFCNGKIIKTTTGSSISDGSIGVGFSGRVHGKNILTAIEQILSNGGVFFRNASGGLMLAYVASGRLLGYIEEHMNSWDCVAGLLMVEEASGVIFKPNPENVLEKGTLVIAAGVNVFDTINSIAISSFAVS